MKGRVSRLQNVTIEDVQDDDSDTTPTSLINGDQDNKIVRDFSFNSNKSSNETSTKDVFFENTKILQFIKTNLEIF